MTLFRLRMLVYTLKWMTDLMLSFRILMDPPTHLPNPPPPIPHPPIPHPPSPTPHPLQQHFLAELSCSLRAFCHRLCHSRDDTDAFRISFHYACWAFVHQGRTGWGVVRPWPRRWGKAGELIYHHPLVNTHVHACVHTWFGHAVLWAWVFSGTHEHKDSVC